MPAVGPRGRRVDREGLGRLLTHHLSCCRPLVRFWVSSPIRSRTAPATCCSKAPPSPPMLRLQRVGGKGPGVDGGPSGPACPLHHIHGPANRSPPLAVKVLGPVGDVDVLVLLPGLLPLPLGCLVRSWLSPLPAHDLCEDVLADGGPVMPAAPGGVPAHHPTPAELKARGSGTLNTWCCHLDPVSTSACATQPHLRPRRAQDNCWGLGWQPGRNPHPSRSSISQAM